MIGNNQINKTALNIQKNLNLKEEESKNNQQRIDVTSSKAVIIKKTKTYFYLRW